MVIWMDELDYDAHCVEEFIVTRTLPQTLSQGFAAVS